MSITKGPWRKEIHNGHLHIIWEGWSVCIVCNSPGPDDESSEDNARLIAAAPDLLEACVDALQFVQNGVSFGYIHLPDSPDRAATFEARIEAAIAKAKGE